MKGCAINKYIECTTMRQKGVNDAYGVATLVQLSLHLVLGDSVDHEHFRHVVRQQLARVTDVYCRLCNIITK